ncbi:MAG: amino acid oxidase, partial [Victivallaceae bacterium]
AGECQYKDSLWEVKTILPSSEIDDSRPILFKPNYHYKNYHCIMGGKIDNVYDVIAAIKLLNNW